MYPIFFSHSSGDARVVGRIKDRLKVLIGESPQIFLSSDGESIRLGKRWLAEIEAALRDAKLMFIFCSENSVKSSWVLFESGHAIGREVDVIPVGLPGFDIARLPAPVNNLQGFTLRDHRGLNNLIAEINKAHGVQHAEQSTEDDFNAIFEGYKPANHLSQVVDNLSFYLEDHLTVEVQEGIPETARIFANRGYAFQLSDSDRLQSHGYMLIHQSGIRPESLLLQIAPEYLLPDGAEQIDFMVRGMRSWEFQNLRFTATLQDGFVIRLHDTSRVSSKLAHEGVTFDDSKGLQNEALRFELTPNSLRGSFKNAKPDALHELNRLIRSLVENGVIAARD